MTQDTTPEGALAGHLASGITTVARAWAITRGDGVVLGFTDHDRDLAFGGVVFRASAGLSARALEQTTGLAVDNSEALGALSDAGLTEADLLAGLYDGAAVVIAEVNWQDVSMHRVIFRGTIGEVARAGGAFRAELRGLTEALGAAGGRVYQTRCSAVLGDGACRFDLGAPGYRTEARAAQIIEDRIFDFVGIDPFEDRWFENGRLEVLDGPAAGQVGVIKNDRAGTGGARAIELWSALGRSPGPGALLRLEAGCDKRAATCRLKFGNLVNFHGFPHIPGEDWLMAYPRSDDRNDGGSLSGSGAGA